MKRFLPLVFVFLFGNVFAGEPTYTTQYPESWDVEDVEITEVPSRELVFPEDHNDAFVCKLEILSNAFVYFVGDPILEDRKSDVEQVIRLRLQNDMSMMSHEYLDYVDASSKYRFQFDELKRRGYVMCEIWTVGDGDYPIAIYVDCALEQFTKLYKHVPLGHKLLGFKWRSLGYASKAGLYRYLEDTLRSQISHIAGRFLRLRDEYCR